MNDPEINLGIITKTMRLGASFLDFLNSAMLFRDNKEFFIITKPSFTEISRALFL